MQVVLNPQPWNPTARVAGRHKPGVLLPCEAAAALKRLGPRQGFDSLGELVLEVAAGGEHGAALLRRQVERARDGGVDRRVIPPRATPQRPATGAHRG